MAKSDSGLSPSEEKKILAEARRRMKHALECDEPDRKRAEKELRFVWNVDNCQWEDEAKKARKARPMLTENRNPSFVRQATNEVRRSRPQIRVLPVDGQGDVYTAQIMEGLIRNIEANSRADMAYDQATDLAGFCGRGYWKVSTQYVGDGFDQEIVIEPVPDPFSIVDDPDVAMPDKSDRKFAFEVEKVKRDEFEGEYGFKAATFEEAAAALGDEAAYWGDEDRVVVANYWRVITVKKPIWMAPDGSTGEGKAPDVGGVKVREHVTRKVEWFCITGTKAISKGEWAGEYIPLVYTCAEQMKISGTWRTKGMTFDAQDLTKANNYLLSAQVENIALTPKVPFIGPKGAFESAKTKWNSINTDMHAYVEYDVIDQNDKALPPPTRSLGVTSQPEIAQVRLGVIDGQRSVIGLMGASMGDSGPETAYKAIEARQTRGDTAIFHMMDNLVRGVRYCGMVIVDLIPRVYDAARVVRIINPDGEPQMQAINQLFVPPGAPMGTPPQMVSFSGKYDVTASAGPAFETQRQRDNALMVDLAGKVPALATVAPDLLAKNLLTGSDGDKIAQRLARTIPKNLLGEGPTPEEQQLQQQVQEMQGALQQAGNEKSFLESELAKQKEVLAREQERTVQTSEKGRIDVEKAHVELQKAEIALLREQIKPATDAAGVTWDEEGRAIPAPEREPEANPIEFLGPVLQALGESIERGNGALAQAIAQSNGQIAQAMAHLADSTTRAAAARRQMKLPDGRVFTSEALQ